MTARFERLCVGTREAVHAVVLQLNEHAKAAVASAAPRVDTDTGEIQPRLYRVTFEEVEDTLSDRQRRFYWGPVLGQIAAQGRQDGRMWDQEAWHAMFKRVVLGYEVVKERVAGRKRATSYRRLRSITSLTVKQMSDYLDEVIALASAELGVSFVFEKDERESVRFRKPQRKPRVADQPQTQAEPA